MALLGGHWVVEVKFHRIWEEGRCPSRAMDTVTGTTFGRARGRGVSDSQRKYVVQFI